MAVMRTPHRTTRRRLAAIAVASTAALAAGLVSALPAGAAPAAAEGRIQYEDAANAVAGSYIVTLKPGEARSGSAEGRALAKKYGATIERTYTKALNGYAIEASETEAERLAADPAVASVVQNRTLSIDATQPSPPSWGLDRIDQRALPLNNSYTYPDSAGQGVTAYVIDTGVRITHSDFGGRAFNGYDAIDNDNVAQDGHGHGTHVAGTVAGSAYGVANELAQRRRARGPQRPAPPPGRAAPRDRPANSLGRRCRLLGAAVPRRPPARPGPRPGTVREQGRAAPPPRAPRTRCRPGPSAPSAPSTC
ncbi:hypothetical protein SGLAM104S_04598 [Streptomyces glaucescens]